jgi:uncharacterized protein (DUF427 family)
MGVKIPTEFVEKHSFFFSVYHIKSVILNPIYMKAIWKNTIIAKSDDVEEIEGNYYFPIDSINKEFFLESNTQSTCQWKGTASYLHIMVDGEINEDAAWYYQNPNQGADILKNRVAFWKGVTIKESPQKINWEMLKVLNSFF